MMLVEVSFVRIGIAGTTQQKTNNAATNVVKQQQCNNNAATNAGTTQQKNNNAGTTQQNPSPFVLSVLFVGSYQLHKIKDSRTSILS
eukprot:scaffold586_cov192-Alexandrium_tamarense.AAC.4